MSSNITVSNNKILSGALGNPDGGIEIYPDSLTGSTFTKNNVRRTPTTGSTSTRERRNTFEKNKFQKNRALDHGVRDCFDDPGNANTWTKNRGRPRTAPGSARGEGRGSANPGLGHDPERDHRVLERDGADHEDVEDLVVPEHRGIRVRAAQGVDEPAPV